MHWCPRHTPRIGVVRPSCSITGMVTCDYAIPAGSNPLLVNLDVTIGATGMPQRVYKVDNAAACGTNGGWFYDVNPPMKPSKITLCPQSCDPLKATIDCLPSMRASLCPS